MTQLEGHPFGTFVFSIFCAGATPHVGDSLIIPSRTHEFDRRNLYFADELYLTATSGTSAPFPVLGNPEKSRASPSRVCNRSVGANARERQQTHPIPTRANNNGDSDVH